MRQHLKLPPWVPRLTRRQRVIRNLTAVVITLFLAWAVLDFPAPTPGLAARWQSARYGLPAPKVLYCADGSGGDMVLQWEDGRLAITKCYSSPLNWALGDFWFTEPEDGGALLVPDMNNDAHTLYFWTEQTNAARAEASLRIRTEANVRITDSDGSSEEAHYDWDVTYEMETAPERNGLCRFEIPIQYEEEDSRLQASAERSALWEFSNTFQKGTGVNRAADFSVSFYDETGALLDTWEKELYNDLREEDTP